MSLSSLHFLVVDDYAIIRHVIEEIVQQSGGRVTKAASGAEALDHLLRGLTIDGIITDYQMPAMNGIELITQARTMPLYRSIPIAMVSNEQDERLCQKALRAGANAWIDKTLIISSLGEWIENVRSSKIQKLRQVDMSTVEAMREYENQFFVRRCGDRRFA